MPPSYLDTIRRHCLPLDPVPTDVAAEVRPLTGIRSVLFDVYGTLFISASGDVGTANSEQRAEAFGAALQAVGVKLKTAGQGTDAELLNRAAEQLVVSIRNAHQRAHQRGIEYPEIEIVLIWDDVIRQLQSADLLAGVPPELDLAALAVEYEVRVNPSWPMPGAAACLQALVRRHLRPGIISNAQFFTPELFPALLGCSTEELGFDPQLQFYSYRSGQAKPGEYLYRQAVEALLSAGVPAGDVLYIGNDLLNDVAAAQDVGFRTALFAGDARSLRLRVGDPRVDGVQPDLIVTHLSQVPDCIA